MAVINKIAIYDNQELQFFKSIHIQNIKDAIQGVEVVHSFDVEKLYDEALDAEVLIAFPVFPPELVDYCKQAKNLKLIHSPISGVDGFLKSGIRDLPVRITSTKGIQRYPVSDHVLAYIFAFLRNYPAFFQAKLDKRYAKEEGKNCDETFEKTVGIIGTGHVGMHIAKKCKLLGMKVLCYKRKPIESEWIDVCYTNDQLDELMKESDFVVVAVPSTPDTREMIGERELRLMKKTAYFINIARGDIVDEKALLNVLSEKAIAGAGLDVFIEKPLPSDSKFWELSNVIMTPHIAASSPYSNDRLIKVTIENLLRFTKDEELLFEIDKEKGY